MTLRAIPVFEKLPDEEFTQQVDFVNVLGVGETISTAAVTITNRDTGSDDTASILVGSPSITSSTTVDYDLTGGEPDSRYIIAVVVTLNTAEKREQWVEMLVPTRLL